MSWPLAWVPFVTPAPIWDAWPLLLPPLLLGIAVAYKATKVTARGRLWWESLRLAGVLLAGLVAAALVLAGFVLWFL